jgi:hypothetical protein
MDLGSSSCRVAGWLASVRADAPESRRQTPNGSSAATRAFTRGRYSVRLRRMSSHVSPGCTSVEYPRCPSPLMAGPDSDYMTGQVIMIDGGMVLV